MNETSINNAIRELEEMTDLLRKILERKITQKQAADKLGITPQAFQTELKNSFSNYIKKRNIITEDHVKESPKISLELQSMKNW